MKERTHIMSGPKAILSNGWSTLNTVNEFDIGVNNSNNDNIKTSEDFSKAVVKSLFIESLIDQLCKLLEKDPHKRHRLYEGICSKLHEMHLIEDTYHIEELASLRGHYQQALLDLMMAPDTRLCSIPCLKLGSSRYANEYEEICFLAAGGFGKVFKARNRLDQVIYAVKKVPLRCQNVAPFARKLNEVKTLAKLNHPNIVQYKAAWLEPLFNITIASAPQSPETTTLSSNDSDVVFRSSQSDSTKESNYILQQEKESGKVAVYNYIKGNSIQRPVMQVSALLYVSMQLCDGTLCEWLYNRNFYNEPVNIPLAVYIMLQAATGVQYLHSCNIVHHDIKPRNIFLSSDLKSVQVGDFGLSCCLQGHDHSDCPLEGGQFGTPLYAAPEQLKGLCDPKSDMFSLGLIFIELLTVFSTEMERVKVLTKVRSNYIPPSIPGPLVSVIKSLISYKPSKRLTATELIAALQDIQSYEFQEAVGETTRTCKIENDSNIVSKLIVKDVKSFLIQERDQLMKDKDREITELKQMLAQKESEIAHLKHLVNQDSS